MLSARITHRPVEERAFPDVVLKSQFFDSMGSRALSSEQRLMLAVLADAINVVHEGAGSPHTGRRNHFTEARNWIFQSTVHSPLSFESVCDALQIDAGALRLRLRALIARHPAGAGSRLRLQLNEANRFHRMSVNRIRRRERPQGPARHNPA